MGHYVRVASYSPQTAAKPAAFVRRISGLCPRVSEATGLYGLYLNKEGWLHKQTLASIPLCSSIPYIVTLLHEVEE